MIFPIDWMKRPANVFIAGIIVGIGLATAIVFMPSWRHRGGRKMWTVEQVMLEPDVSVDRVNFGEDRNKYSYTLFVEVRSFGPKDIPALATARADANDSGTQRELAMRCLGMDGVRESAWNVGHRVYRDDHALPLSTSPPPYAYLMLQIDPSWRRWRPDGTRNDVKSDEDPAVVCVSIPMAGHSITELTKRFGDYLTRTVPPYNELSWDAGEIQLWTVYSHDTNDNTWYATRVWIEANKRETPGS